MSECTQCSIGSILGNGFCDMCGFNSLQFVEEHEAWLDTLNTPEFTMEVRTWKAEHYTPEFIAEFEQWTDAGLEAKATSDADNEAFLDEMFGEAV